MKRHSSLVRVAVGFLVSIVGLAGCSDVRRIPDPPQYGSLKVLDETVYPLAVTEQGVKVVVRENAGALQAKLNRALLCRTERVERRDGFRVVNHELATEDEISKWAGYGGAGLTALLVGVGMARGQSPGRGVVILGAWGIPLAGLGAYQQYRERAVTEPAEPRVDRVVGEAIACEDQKALPVQMTYADGSTDSVALSSDWMPLAIADANLPASSVFLPTSFDGATLAAFLPAVAAKSSEQVEVRQITVRSAGILENELNQALSPETDSTMAAPVSGPATLGGE